MSLTSSQQKIVFPKDMLKSLTALWGLRFAINHENGPRIMTASWLSAVGDFIEWPLELIDQFHMKSSNSVNSLKSNNNKVNKRNKTIIWYDAFEYFEEVYSYQKVVLDECFQKSIDILEQHWLTKRDQDIVWKNISLIGDLIQLSEFERKVLLFFVCIESSRHLRMFFGDMDMDSPLKTSEMLACMIGCTTQVVMDALNQKQTLMATGLVSKGHNFEYFFEFLVISDRVKIALTYPNKDLNELMRHFTDQATLGQLTADDIPHLQDSLRMLSNVMSNALLTQENGVNILLYGASGTGKTEFAKLLAKQVGAILYEVGFTDNYGQAGSSRDRYVSLLMAQNFLSTRNDTLLLFDEVEDVLDGGGLYSESDPFTDNQNRNQFSKAWVNQQLENNPVPTIWICNDHRFIDSAYLRRFLFHLEFRVPPRSVRQQVAERYFKELNLSEATLRKISMHATLSPAQLKNTARLLKLNDCHDLAESERLLENTIQNSMKVMGQAFGKSPAKSITPYRLDYLNVDSQLPLSRMLEALVKRPQASLCFYGPPGTGKTQLAEYVAEKLDKSLIIKRASDLLSKWVGGSEQNIAKMFKEARDEQAILFLDEADSFLRDRHGMSRSWEVSQVNELLQQMEYFNGIFICATNLFDQLDQAALRRFSFKIHFDYLKLNQRLELFAESLELATVDLSDNHQQRVQKLDQLTPGDFATALRQAYTLDEIPTAEALLEQLEKECALKNPGRNRRSIGFT